MINNWEFENKNFSNISKMMKILIFFSIFFIILNIFFFLITITILILRIDLFFCFHFHYIYMQKRKIMNVIGYKEIFFMLMTFLNIINLFLVVKLWFFFNLKQNYKHLFYLIYFLLVIFNSLIGIFFSLFLLEISFNLNI